MADFINIFSQNCRGLKDMQKRRDLFQHIRTKKYNIACLQDVHIDKNMCSYVKAEWGFNLILSAKQGSNVNRGVMILINNNFSCDIGRVITDPDGNFVIAELKMNDRKIVLTSIYGPNDDQPQFYKKLQQHIKSFENDKVIICGDWNLVLDQEKDTENYRHINNPRARNEVLKIIEQDNYVDIYRLFKDDKGFTWRRLNPEKKQARLDFFLISDENIQFVDDCTVISGYRTDHSGIILKLKLNENERGKSYWKFNNSLLKDQEYIRIVKKTIKEVVDTYKVNQQINIDNSNNNNDNSNNDYENIEFTINDQMLLEMILLMIRGETIKYSSRKKKEREKIQKQLEEDIVKLEKNITENFQQLTQEDYDSLEEKKSRLYNIRKNIIEGVMVRSRCRYQELGEKPTSYFFNLEKRNYTNKVITKIIGDNDQVFTETNEILDTQKRYYKDLYSEKIEIDNTPIAEILGENPRKLSENDAHILEGEIRYSELLEALKSMKNSKTPGNDGFTAEFFKFFWIDLKFFVLKSLNYAYNSGSLSITQRQGIITCLPKPNKSPFYLKNWRPISLLNVVYKLASTVIASRLKTVLQKIIHEDQKGFIAGRFIGENIRLIYDILFETKQQEIPGLLLSIDFQQAFDSVSWKFIDKTLDYFNFGPSFKKWIKIFQNGAESCILQNGHMTEYFCLQRGCRQGDPISPYIFILCAEVLGHMIRKDNSIRGITINEKHFKLSQYADDTQVFLDGSEQSLKNTLENLNFFYLMSGLKINIEKTRAVWIGSMNKSNRQLCRDFDLDWDQKPIKILGVTFTPEVFDVWQHNAPEILQKVENILAVWSKRKLTLQGKITIIKSVALSKFVHLFLSLPNPPDNLIQTLNKMLYKFLWNSGPDRIKRKVIVKNLSKGGLRMIKIDKFIHALKITWLRRQILQENCTWNSLSEINLTNIYSKGDNYSYLKSEEIRNHFFKDTLHGWNIFCKAVPIENVEDILCSPIWFNSNFNQGHNLFIKEWYDKGIRNIVDLLDNEGKFYQFNDFRHKYAIQGTFLDYYSILRKIPNEWKTKIQANNLICQNFKNNVVQNCYVKYLTKDKKGSKTFYDIMVGVKEATPPSPKWENIIGNIDQEEWNSYNTFLRELKEVKLQEFQYKINNYILVTKSFLFKINKIDNDRCSFCNLESETIPHIFIHCDKVKEFWLSLQTWLQTHSNISLQLTKKNLIFSKQANKRQDLQNYILVLAKYFIYKTKFFMNRLRMDNFITYLKRKFCDEMYLNKVNNTFDNFISKWSALYTVFIDDYNSNNNNDNNNITTTTTT